MRNRTTLWTMLLVSSVLWVGLILFMNYCTPTLANQGVVLVLWGGTVGTTLVAPSYLMNRRLARPLGPRRDLTRATRQGVLGGVLAMVLLALQLLRLLNPITAVVLLLVVILVEVLAYLRER